MDTGLESRKGIILINDLFDFDGEVGAVSEVRAFLKV
jgi:hypothetical protein